MCQGSQCAAATATAATRPTQEVKLLWHQLDTLLRGSFVSKHIDGATGYRWGEKLRGAEFRGHNHEVGIEGLD